MASRTFFRAAIILYLALTGCGNPRDAHRFTDVVETKPSPGGKLLAALVWSEHGPGKPHLSAVVLAVKGGDPLDGDAVVIASEDYRPLDFRWTGPDALDVRLPCGAWSSLANQWRAPGTGRAVAIEFTAPLNCLAAAASPAKPVRSSALPPGASQPPGIMFSPK